MRSASTATRHSPTFCAACAGFTSPTTATTAIWACGFFPTWRLQRPRPAAHRRTPAQRQHLRRRADRHRIPDGRRSHRSCRDHPRPELVAVRHQRVLRRHQCDHAEAPTAEGLEASASLGTLRHAQGPPQLTAVRSQRRGAVLLSGSMYGSEGQRRLFFKEFDDPVDEQRHRRTRGRAISSPRSWDG